MAPRVIHTAQALVDQVMAVPALPERGGNVMAGAVTRYAGGAVTVLLAAARSGARAVHAGAHGTGPNGDLVRETLRAAGVSLSAPPLPDLDTGICVVLVEPTGERTFVTTLGAERRVTLESLSRCVPAAGDILCVSGYSLIEPTRTPLLAWLGSLSGPRVVFDPGAIFTQLDGDTQEEMLALTDVYTANAAEAEALTGAGEWHAAAADLSRRLRPGAMTVVRDGARGCVLHRDGDSLVVPGYPQIPVDTNGAGDTHTGVMLACVARGMPWAEAARRANAAGAIKVTRPGPTSAPFADQIDDFLASDPATST